MSHSSRENAEDLSSHRTVSAEGLVFGSQAATFLLCIQMVKEEKALVSLSCQDTNTITGGCSGLNEKCATQIQAFEQLDNSGLYWYCWGSLGGGSGI